MWRCPIRSAAITLAQNYIHAGRGREYGEALALIEEQARRNDPFAAGLEARLASALIFGGEFCGVGRYMSLLGRIEDSHALKKYEEADIAKLMHGTRRGSRSALISLAQNLVGSFHGDSEGREGRMRLLQDILAGSFFGTRERLAIVSAARGTRELHDRELLQLSIHSIKSGTAPYDINTVPYPGEPEYTFGNETGLHIACSRGFLSIVTLLVDNGADVNGLDHMGETPLLHACRAGRYEVTKYLLDKGGLPRKCGFWDESPLHWLFSFRKDRMPEVAKLLLEAGAELESMAKEYCTEGDGLESHAISFASGTPLHRAVSRLSYPAVKCLLECGASPLKQSSFAPYHSPLTLACLLNLSLNTEQSMEDTPVTSLGLNDILRLSHHTDRALMQHAVVGPTGIDSFVGCEDVVAPDSILKSLLDTLTPEAANKVHCLPFAARRLPEFLLDADPLLRIAIHGEKWAKALQHTMSLLKSFGESFDDESENFSLLHLACSAGCNEIVHQLLLLDDSLMSSAKRGRHGSAQPPLHYALHSGRDDIVQLLLDHGADPKQRFRTDYIYDAAAPEKIPKPLLGEEDCFDRRIMTGLRSTLLHTCANVGSKESIVRDLIERGLKVNSYDSNWQSPLYLAIRGCHFALADLLLSLGARLTELRDDLTIFGQLAEEGFTAPVASFVYILKKLKKGDPTIYMSNFKRSRTILHELMASEATIRNRAWAEELICVFLQHIPDRRLLDIQEDGTADTALHVAVRQRNMLGVNLLLEAGADANVPNYEDGRPLDLAFMEKRRLQSSRHLEDDPDSATEVMHQLRLICLALMSKTEDPGSRPPMKYRMSNADSDRVYRRRQALGVDLKSINQLEVFYEGAVREIVEDIAAALRPVFTNKLPDDPKAIVADIILEELAKAPEFTHRRYPRQMRFEHQLAWALAGFSSVSIVFDPEHLAIQLTLDLERSDSGAYGTPNFMKHDTLSYEDSTMGTRVITIRGGKDHDRNYTSALTITADEEEEIGSDRDRKSSVLNCHPSNPLV